MEPFNLEDPEEYYRLAHDVVDCLAQWPALPAAEKERAVRIEVALQAFREAGAAHGPAALPPVGRQDLRGAELAYRYHLLERNPSTVNHAAQNQGGARRPGAAAPCSTQPRGRVGYWLGRKPFAA